MSQKFGKAFLTVLASVAAVVLTSQFAFAADADKALAGNGLVKCFAGLPDAAVGLAGLVG